MMPCYDCHALPAAPGLDAMRASISHTTEDLHMPSACRICAFSPVPYVPPEAKMCVGEREIEWSVGRYVGRQEDITGLY